MAAEMSVNSGFMDAKESDRIKDLIRRAGLPDGPPNRNELASEKMFELMKVDKKVQSGQLRLVLLKGVGRAFITSDYGEDALKKTLGMK
jgi:3-dehydroquinate synthase